MNEAMPAASQPRVLHVTSALDPGGIETWLLRIVRHPDGTPLVGGILALSAREGLLAPQFRECGIPIYCLPPANNPLRFIADLAGILRSTGPWHGVHSHVHRRSALVHLASLMARVPLRVTHSHNTKGQETASRNPLRGMLSGWATYCINAISNLRLACSRDAATALFGKPSEEDPKVLCMPYGIDLESFLRSSEAPASRASLGIPKGAIVVGHVGRFMPQKNHEFLLRVAAEAIDANPRLHFLLIGDGPLRPAIQKLAISLGVDGHISFTGNRLDVPSLMRHAMDCFFFPSHWEGLGIVALEAQALGLRCLLSDAIPIEANRLPEQNRVFALGATPSEVAVDLLSLAASGNDRGQAGPEPGHFLYSLDGNVDVLHSAYGRVLEPSAFTAPPRSPAGRLAPAAPSLKKGTPPWS